MLYLVLELIYLNKFIINIQLRKGSYCIMTELVLDSLNLDEIKFCLDHFPIARISSNPRIISKLPENVNLKDRLLEIREFLGDEFPMNTQAVSLNWETMVEEGKLICDTLGKKSTNVKIPVTEQGLKAIKELKKMGYLVCATTCLTPYQAMMAAMLEPDSVALYYNSSYQMSIDGAESIRMIKAFTAHNNITVPIAAAGMRNGRMISEAWAAGADAIATTYDVLRDIFATPAIRTYPTDFITMFESHCGKGKTMVDVMKG